MEMTTKLKTITIVPREKDEISIYTHLRHISQCGYLYKYILRGTTFSLFR